MTSITVDSLQVLITANAKDLDAKLANIANQLGDTGKSADKFSKMGTLAFGAVAGAAAALANKGINMITNSIDGAIKRVDTLKNAPKVLQNLGFSAEESARAVKLIDKGVQGLPTSLDEIASSLVAIASSSGLSIDKATDLTVAFNNMALAGGKGPAEAQRALVQFTQALGRGKFQAQDFNTLMEVMPAQLNQVAKTLLGASANSGQLRDALTSGEVSMKDFNDAVINLNTKGGSNFASFADQAKTATGGIATGWSLVQTAITRGIANIISAVGSGNITAAFGNLRTAVDTTFQAISGFITFIITYKDIFLPLAVGIGTVVAAVTAWHIATSIAAAAQAAFNAVLLLNPIGVVVAAIAALVAGLVYFFTQTETGRKAWGVFTDFLMSAGKGAVDFIINAFSAITGFFTGLWDGIKGIFNGFIDFVKNNWFIILLAVFTGGLALIVGAVVRNWDSIKQFTSNLINSVVGFFNSLPGKIGAAFTSAKNTVVNIWNAIPGWFSGIISNIGNTANNVVKYFKDAFDKAVTAIKSIDWGSIGKNIIEGIGNGIANMGKWLAQKAVEAVNNAKEAIKNFFGIHSPSRVMRDEVGKMIGAGMAIGIDDSSKDVMKSMKDLANVSIGSFDSSVSVQHGFSDFTDSGNSQPLIINVGGERLVDTVIQGINGRSFLGGSSVINV
jgi:tape measure domain-containing protein